MSIKVVFFDIGETLVSKKKWVEGAKEFLSVLAKAKIRMGLFSNTAELMREELADLLPEDFEFGRFEDGLVLLSSETGIEKKSLQSFSFAVQHAGVSPWETAFVGENIKENHFAQGAGMRAYRVSEFPGDFAELAKVIFA